MSRKQLNLPHKEVTYENALENGRYIKHAVEVSVKDSDKMAPFRCIDFAMDHLQAIGADGQLVDVTGRFGDRTFESLEDFGKHIASLESKLDAPAPAPQETKNNDEEN